MDWCCLIIKGRKKHVCQRCLDINQQKNCSDNSFLTRAPFLQYRPQMPLNARYKGGVRTVAMPMQPGKHCSMLVGNRNKINLHQTARWHVVGTHALCALLLEFWVGRCELCEAHGAFGSSTAPGLLVYHLLFSLLQCSNEAQGPTLLGKCSNSELHLSLKLCVPCHACPSLGLFC